MNSKSKLIWDPGDLTRIETIPLQFPHGIGLMPLAPGAEDLGNGVVRLRAGTPILADGATTGDADVIGVLAGDFYFYKASSTAITLAPVIVSGYVDRAKAEASYGADYDAKTTSALAAAGVYLQDNAAIESTASTPFVVFHETYSAIDEGIVTLSNPTITGEAVTALLEAGRVPLIVASKESNPTLVLYYSGVDTVDEVAQYAFFDNVGEIGLYIPVETPEEAADSPGVPGGDIVI